MDTRIVMQNPESGFWRRQFDNTPSEGQIIFDVIFGVLMPVLCFIADPGIMRGKGLFGSPDISLRVYSPFVYGLSLLAIPALGLWLAFGRRIKAGSGLLSGVLAAGSFCSTALGFLILPLTIIGLLAIIGLLGFTPLIAGFVYCRNAVRSFKRSTLHAPKARSVQLLLLGFVVAVGLPALGNFEAARVVSSSTEQVLHGDEDSMPDAARKLRQLRWYANADQIVTTYRTEEDPIRKERLAKAYR